MFDNGGLTAYLALLLGSGGADLPVHQTTFFVDLCLAELLLHRAAVLPHLALPLLAGGADLLHVQLALPLLPLLALLLSPALLLLDHLSDHLGAVHTAHARNVLAVLLSHLGTLLLSLLLGRAFLRDTL